MPEKPPAIESFKESTKSPESELSPEVLEKVMNKVQDINEAGVAYSFVSGGPYSAGSIFEQDNLQKTKLDFLNSWTVAIKDVDQKTFDLSVKNPNKKDEAEIRSPKEILEDIKSIDQKTLGIVTNISKNV